MGFGHRVYKNYDPRAAIVKKTAQVQGVLVPLPVTWYVTALNEAGFETIEIVDAQWCFNTFLCHKR